MKKSLDTHGYPRSGGLVLSNDPGQVRIGSVSVHIGKAKQSFVYVSKFTSMFQGRKKVPRTGGTRYFLPPTNRGVPGICLTSLPRPAPKKCPLFLKEEGLSQM